MKKNNLPAILSAIVGLLLFGLGIYTKSSILAKIGGILLACGSVVAFIQCLKKKIEQQEKVIEKQEAIINEAKADVDKIVKAQEKLKEIANEKLEKSQDLPDPSDSAAISSRLNRL